MTERVARFLAELERCARGGADVRVALVIGSQARTDTPADEWSDVDVVLAVDDAEARVADAGWLTAFGTPELTFLEDTPVGGLVERRVLYADGLEVDFIARPGRGLRRRSCATPRRRAIRARGERDRPRRARHHAGCRCRRRPPPPDPGQLVHDFWYHALWAAKKLRRGEGLTARGGRRVLQAPPARARPRARADAAGSAGHVARRRASPRSGPIRARSPASGRPPPGRRSSAPRCSRSATPSTRSPRRRSRRSPGVAEARARLAALLAGA